MKVIPMPMRPWVPAILMMDSCGYYDKELHCDLNIKELEAFIPKLRQYHARLKEKGMTDSEVNDTYAEEEKHIRELIEEWKESKWLI